MGDEGGFVVAVEPGALVDPAVGASLIRRSDTSPHVWGLPVRCGMLAGEMSRHTTFRFCLDPTVEQRDILARHAGAWRFAFN